MNQQDERYTLSIDENGIALVPRARVLATAFVVRETGRIGAPSFWDGKRNCWTTNRQEAAAFSVDDLPDVAEFVMAIGGEFVTNDELQLRIGEVYGHG